MATLYEARDLWLSLSKEEIWALPEGPLKLRFDDGEIIETDNRETIFSWYLGVFHRLYPQTPLLSYHHINGEPLKKSTHTKILGFGLFDAYEASNETLDLEELSRTAYEITNIIFNDFTERLKPYVSTLSAFDVVDALHHPDIKAANDWIQDPNTPATSGNIERCQNRILSTLKKPGALVGNAFARMSKSQIVNAGQILQILGPRGFTTDIDSRIFPYPILVGYAQGLTDPHDMLIETRSAAKALIFATDPVAQSEYFNREMQLSTSIISRLHKGDCGTNYTIPWRMKAKDFSTLAGKIYVCPEEGDLKVLKRWDTHLEGKTIQLRSVLGCEHPDAYGVCEVCFGKLSTALPRQTNIGHVCATVLCEKVSQNMLSTKHYEGSSVVGGIEELSERHSRFISLGVEGSNAIMLAPHLKGQKVKMLFESKEAPSLAMVDHVDTVEKLSISQISELSEVTIEVFNKEGITMDIEKIPISHGSRLSSLTHEALEYIRQHGYIPINSQQYVVDLSHWDTDKPLFRLPMKHPDMVEMMKTIKKFVMSNHKGSKEGSYFRSLKEFQTPVQGLQEFHQLITSKLDVNLAHLEIIVLSTMIQGPEGVNHFPPVPKYTGVVSSYNMNMLKRSEGVAMAYQQQHKPLIDFASYMSTLKRPDSAYDNILAPFPMYNPVE